MRLDFVPSPKAIFTYKLNYLHTNRREIFANELRMFLTFSLVIPSHSLLLFQSLSYSIVENWCFVPKLSYFSLNDKNTLLRQHSLADIKYLKKTKNFIKIGKTRKRQ